ncbi:hypothetical protein [uncultured Nocardioides sp.]|uniref:hypothetical protein n=1 Tax=uncultured Nocardioides sp. TaxID=198441 RepID=UPI00262C92E7|nr:hypothetical protein [uncultured Nocardioides sp.]
MTTKRERKQQRKQRVSEHLQARAAARRRSLLVTLTSLAVVVAGLVAVVGTSDLDAGTGPPAWLVVATAAATLALAGVLLARRRTAEAWQRARVTTGAVGVAVVGVALLVSQALATWGSGDAAAFAALGTAVLVLVAALLLARFLVRPGRSSGSSGNSTSDLMNDVSQVLD